jgi:hypothetical protein
MLRRFALALGLGSLFGLGCRSEGGFLNSASARDASVRERRLPNSHGARVAFVPDGRHALVMPLSAETYAYDLETGQVLWQTSLAAGPRGVAFSPRGGFAVLVDRDGVTAHARVFDMRSGSVLRTFRFAEFESSPNSYYGLAGSVLSVSDSGRFLAVGVGTNGEPVDIFSLETGKRVFHSDQKGSGFVLIVAFEPGTHRLVAYSSSAHVWVMDQNGDDFAAVKSFEGAVWPGWTSAGLGLATQRGLELWSGGDSRVVLATEAAFLREGSTTPFNVESLAAPPPRWSFSDDGAHVTVWNASELRIHRVADGARIFARAEPFCRSGVVCAARWAPHHFRTYLFSGDYLDIDLDRAEVVRAEGFGAPGAFSRNWLSEGASFERSYSGLLSPTGRFLDLSSRGEPHTMISLE